MPFMKGKAPIRRTLQYLQSSALVVRDRVKIVSVNYNTYGDHHKGAKEFVFWHLAQLQYKNPQIQVVTFKNITPSPFLSVYFEDGQETIMDVDSKSRTEIHDHFKKVFCKTDEVLAREARETQDNPANFGWGCDRQCICEIPGQLPCPGVVPLPKHMRGKYKKEFASTK